MDEEILGNLGLLDHDLAQRGGVQHLLVHCAAHPLLHPLLETGHLERKVEVFGAVGEDVSLVAAALHADRDRIPVLGGFQVGRPGAITTPGKVSVPETSG